MITRFMFTAIAVVSVAIPGAANAAAVSADRIASVESLITRTVDELVKFRGGISGYSVVVVADGAPDFILTRGIANANSGSKVTPHTAFYIASQTKSYTGLLAAKLDREGVFRLDTTLDQVWPGLKLPVPLNAKAITFRQLLSHSAGFDVPSLQFRTAYTDEIPASEYRRFLEEGATVGKGGFEYTNTGYLIYAAALELRTGRGWKEWLGHEILEPLELRQTYSRSSKIALNDIAWGHQWDGSRWVAILPKSDAIMHAAGGLFVSSRDLANWMRWQLRDGLGQQSLTAGDFHTTRRDLSGGGLGEGDFGIKCTGYGLGWSTCEYGGAPMLYHGGTYTGVRTHLFMLTQQRVGVAISANSDAMTGTLGQFFMAVISASLLGEPQAEEMARQMIEGYGERSATQGDNRTRARSESDAETRWAGWKWKPEAKDLAAYAGMYRNPLYGELLLEQSNGELVATLGVMKRQLRPAREGLFATRETPVQAWDPVEFALVGGLPRTVKFDGQEYLRVR